MSDFSARSGPGGGPPPRLLVAGSQLRVDVVTAEVVDALRAAGVEPVLLKGPTIARWLYDEPAERPYADTDLLVPPGAAGRVGDVLGSMGFRPFSRPVGSRGPAAATAWLRDDRTSVDVHVTLIGANVPPERVWEVLSAETEPWSVARTTVAALRPPARALHVVLHSAQHGRDWDGPRRDVEQAVARLPRPVWVEAARVARDLDATPALAAGLLIAAGGAELVSALGLPPPDRADVLLRAGNAPPLAVGIDWLTRSEGAGRRAAYVARRVFPTPSEMRRWAPIARRGPVGLALAYVLRPFWLVAKLPAALRALRDARVRAAGSRERER